MPTLDWIGKQAVVKHHKEVPFRLLEPVPELSLPSPVSSERAASLPLSAGMPLAGTGRGAGGEGDFGGNLIVQGDNLHALKALLPRYAGQVKCVYIDPPYNTGNEGWAYNDNVNSPEIRKWLDEVVGKEGETLDRHDRWPSNTRAAISPMAATAARKSASANCGRIAAMENAVLCGWKKNSGT